MQKFAEYSETNYHRASKTDSRYDAGIDIRIVQIGEKTTTKFTETCKIKNGAVYYYNSVVPSHVQLVNNTFNSHNT